ncbi:hypothetical protein CMK11_12345 [Candidatus Poribacteria bacterium]|nr:hypothetical protein [Candidatus Poribacteria bacterium]
MERRPPGKDGPTVPAIGFGAIPERKAFHSRLRDEFPNTGTSTSVKEAQAPANMWQGDCSQERPHGPLCHPAGR